MRKYIKIIFFVFISFIFFDNNVVYAETAPDTAKNSDVVCIKGFLYNIFTPKNVNIPTIDFYKANPDELLMSPIPGNVGYSSIDGKTFSYSLYGRFANNGDPKETERCFVIHLNAEQKIKYDTLPEYLPYFCAGTYNIDDILFIEKDSKDKKEDEIDVYSSQFIDEDTGLITVKLKIRSGSSLDKVKFDRINVTTLYDDKSSNAKKGSISKDEKTKTITISGITPFNTSISNPDSNSVYSIVFSLNGIVSDDINVGSAEFKFDFTSEQKASAIKECGGGDGGIFIGETNLSIIPDYLVEIQNPIKDSTICRTVVNYKNSLPSQSQVIVESYISECFSDKIKYSEKTEIEKRVKEKYETIVDIYSGKTASKYLADIDKLNCTSTLMGIPTVDKNSASFETKISYESIGKYFGMVCIETYYVDPGKPSLVLPGQGVDYSNKVEIRKTCSIFNTGKAIKKPQCKTTSSPSTCVHTRQDGSIFILEDGGPNDSFDSCVTSCDGGEYTQECINVCNSKVYDDDRGGNLLSELKNNYSFNVQTTKVNDEVIDLTTGKTDDVRVTACSTQGYGTFTCGKYLIVIDPNILWQSPRWDTQKYGKATVYGALKADGTRDVLYEYGYTETCNSKFHTVCNFVIVKGPDGCADDPNADLQAQIDAAKVELSNYEAIAKEESELLNYSITFYDSTNGLYYEVTGSSTDSSTQDKPRLIIEETTDPDILELIEQENFDKQTNKTWTISDVGDTINGLSFLQSSVIYDVKLPTAQSLKGSGEPIILKDNFIKDKYYSYTLKDVKLSNIYDKNNNVLVENANLIKFSDYTLTADERGKFGIPGNLYFTAMNSNNVNVIANPVDITEEELAKVDNLTLSVYGEQILYVLYNNINNIYIKLQPGYNDSSKGGTTLSAKFDVADFYCYYGTVCGGIKSCDNSQHYCYYDGAGNYYGPAPAGRKLKDYEEFAKLCGAQATESPICVYAGGKYWGKDGEVLSSEEEMKAECESVESGPGYERIDVILDPDSVPTECKYCDTGGPTEKGLRYYYREIKLTDVFPNDRQPRYNWSSSAIDKTDNSYIIDPIALTYAIESKGESIFDDTSSGEVDYEFDITRRLISEIRAYNKGRLSDGSKRTYLDFSIVGKDTNNAYSSAVASWYPELVTRMQSITSCNNAYGSTCDDIGAYVEKVEKTK